MVERLFDHSIPHGERTILVVFHMHLKVLVFFNLGAPKDSQKLLLAHSHLWP